MTTETKTWTIRPQDLREGDLVPDDLGTPWVVDKVRVGITRVFVRFHGTGLGRGTTRVDGILIDGEVQVIL